MSHSLYQLNAMSRQELETIAGELNIKINKKMDDENLAFAILEEMLEQTIIPEKIFIIIVVEKSVHN